MTAIAAEHGIDIYKTDTKQAFLYGDLEEDEQIYIYQAPRPPRLVVRAGSRRTLSTIVEGCLRNGPGCSSVAYEDIDLDEGQ